jgi:uncharacterized protein YkwD
VPTGAPARHRAGQRSVHDPTQRSVHDPTQRSVHDPTRRSARRVRYLLCDLFALLVLTGGGLYLAHSFGSTSPPASGKVTALQTPATCGSCAGHPYRAAVSVPPVPSQNLSSAPTRRHSTQPTPTASVSSSPAAPSPTASATGSPGAAPGTPAAQVLALINQARSAAGLPALTITAGLETSASAHDMTMLGGCGLSHQCPAEPDLGARETAAGVTWSACGENIGDGGPVADTNAAMAQMAVGLTQDMLNETPPDDGHRLNILSSSFAHIGIAVYRDSSGTVWLTQDFSN